LPCHQTTVRPHQIPVNPPSDVIPGVVPNRGLAPQPDLSLYGLHYLQRVSDADKPPFQTAGQALHIEPGLFMNVPPTIKDPTPQGTIVRMASIPHGVTVMMQGPTPSTTPVAWTVCWRSGHWTLCEWQAWRHHASDELAERAQRRSCEHPGHEAVGQDGSGPTQIQRDDQNGEHGDSAGDQAG